MYVKTYNDNEYKHSILTPSKLDELEMIYWRKNYGFYYSNEVYLCKTENPYTFGYNVVCDICKTKPLTHNEHIIHINSHYHKTRLEIFKIELANVSDYIKDKIFNERLDDDDIVLLLSYRNEITPEYALFLYSN